MLEAKSFSVKAREKVLIAQYKNSLLGTPRNASDQKKSLAGG
jgi:hypothetical protein